MTPSGLLAAAAGLAVAAAFASSSLPVLGGALGAWRLASVIPRVWTAMGSGAFHKVDRDLYRLDLWWRPLPVVLLPVSAVLVRDGGGGWVLVDAGAHDNWSQAYATKLTAAVRKTIPQGERLAVILLTHGHPDHVGAVPALLRAWPEAQVLLHEDEAPFLLGPQQYLPPGSTALRVQQALGALPRQFVKLPESRVALLRGSSGGSLRAHGVHSLSWIATPGHSPGHISVLHEPTGMLIGGDVLFNVLPSVAWSSGVMELLTRPLRASAGLGARLALAPARAALEGVLGSGRAGGLLEGALGGLAPALGRLQSPGAIVDATLRLLTSGGPDVELRAMPLGKAVGQELITLRPSRLLPGMAVRISPLLICSKPHCDTRQGEESLCRLAGTSYKRLLVMHDATGKGLPPADVAVFCDALQAAAKAAR